jgi:hypothetical protein
MDEGDEELRDLRSAFWRDKYRENKRIEATIARRRDATAAAAATADRETRHHGDRLHAPRHMLWSAARYWFYAHVLSRGFGSPAIQKGTLARALALSDRDADRMMPEVPNTVCLHWAERIASGGAYPRAGVPAEMAEWMGVDADSRLVYDRSPAPPGQVRRYIQAEAYEDLSRFFYHSKNGRPIVWGWSGESYAEGEHKETLEVKAIAQPGMREKLLAIFDD